MNMKPKPYRPLRSALLVLALATASAASWPASAGEPAPPENVIHFAATATLEVTWDLLTVNLQATREGADAATVQNQLKQVLDAALAEAKKTAQPGALDVRTGQFNISPRYGRDGRINGWQGTAELVLEGRDHARVAQAAGRIQGMTVAGTGYSLSRELRDRHEAELTAQAIQKYRARAADMARQFGFGSYVLREVHVAGQEPGFPVPMVKTMMRSSAGADMAEALPTEPGKGVLTATVQGSVQLIR
jgi:predicted secreted protein